MVRKSGCRNVEVVLNFTRDHARGVRREEQANNLQSRFCAESGEAVGGAGDEEGIRFGNISIVAEIQ